MKKLSVLLVFAMVVTLFSSGAVLAATAQTTFVYPDVTLNQEEKGNAPQTWDLTACDLTLSYTIDMSEIANAGWSITEVGLREIGGDNFDPANSGYLFSRFADATSNPIVANLNDFHELMKGGTLDEYYDASEPETPIEPPILSWTFYNHAFWFDRDSVGQLQAGYWNYKDGITYNTGGVYNVEISYHSIDPGTATMFATINGEGQGFYTDGYVSDAPPPLMPVGRTFTGDMTQMQAFWGRGSGGGVVDISNIEISGCFVVEEGMVTGGGWIDSPENAYKPDPSLTGKATFGFVSKYKKGATMPTGNTEFKFKTADMNFSSSSYDWLVVTGGDYARYKGEGTINGMLDPNGLPYKFMLWAGDKEPDTFRIKIWQEDELGNETVIYDNGFNQAIGGGNIVVHTK